MVSPNPILSSIILIFGIQAILLIVLLLRKRPVKQSYFFLALLLIFFALMSLNITLINTLIAIDKVYLFKYFQLELLFGIGPSLYFFTKSITDANYRISKKAYIHFIPVIIEFLYFRTKFYRIGFDNRMVIYQNDASVYNSNIDIYSIVYLVLQWTAIISMLIYIFLSVQLLIRYNQWIKDHYSNLKNKSLGWLKIPVFFYSGFWFIWIAFRSIDTFIFQDTLKEYYFLPSFIGVSIITCWIGFKVYVTSQTNTSGYLASTRKTIKRKPIPEEAQKLLSLMENQKPYLNPELDLSTLSQLVGINTKIVSYYINSDFGTNFYEFVNKYRVEEFKKRVLEEEGNKFSLLGLAFECGFNSKSTFNHVFKKFTGQTPSEYSFQNKKKSERKHSD